MKPLCHMNPNNKAINGIVITVTARSFTLHTHTFTLSIVQFHQNTCLKLTDPRGGGEIERKMSRVALGETKLKDPSLKRGTCFPFRCNHTLIIGMRPVKSCGNFQKLLHGSVEWPVKLACTRLQINIRRLFQVNLSQRATLANECHARRCLAPLCARVAARFLRARSDQRGGYGAKRVRMNKGIFFPLQANEIASSTAKMPTIRQH